MADNVVPLKPHQDRTVLPPDRSPKDPRVVAENAVLGGKPPLMCAAHGKEVTGYWTEIFTQARVPMNPMQLHEDGTVCLPENYRAHTA